MEAVKFKPFTANLNGTGVFPSENHIRVVWVGIEPSEIIKDLQKQIDAVLEGLFTKEKDFQPHVTLARVKNITDKKQFAEQIKNLKIKPISFEVNEFKLIECQLSEEGPLYKDVAVFS